MSDKKYIDLPQVSNQKIRKKYYVPESIKHPAKAHIPMMIWILKKFVDPGKEEIVTEEMLREFDKKIEWCKCDN